MTAPNPFAAPSTGGETLPPRDLVGHLLIVRPLSVEMVKTANYGDKEAIKVNVCVLTQQNLDSSYGVVAEGVLWFSGRLIGSLKNQLGDLVLGRMAVGTGKPGQNPPFVLESAVEDPQAVDFAGKWLAAHPEFQTALKAPAAQPAPAPAAVPTPAPVPTPTVPAAIPAAMPTPAPLPAAPAAIPTATIPVAQVPAAIPTAAPAAVPQPGGLHPDVLKNLGPEAIAQLQAFAAQQSVA
ncbi:hypothetical protein ACQEVZ_20185 [Dactylosporangium sp. CA-152071]|uniref:hypothetical protein n=1 Tax=Dactylosporangium sp. CA-152071 TaxID=3239933 RepID=UPI003D926B64